MIKSVDSEFMKILEGSSNIDEITERENQSRGNKTTSEIENENRKTSSVRQRFTRKSVTSIAVRTIYYINKYLMN